MRQHLNDHGNALSVNTARFVRLSGNNSCSRQFVLAIPDVNLKKNTFRCDAEFRLRGAQQYAPTCRGGGQGTTVPQSPRNPNIHNIQNSSARLTMYIASRKAPRRKSYVPGALFLSKLSRIASLEPDPPSDRNRQPPTAPYLCPSRVPQPPNNLRQLLRTSLRPSPSSLLSLATDVPHFRRNGSLGSLQIFHG